MVEIPKKWLELYAALVKRMPVAGYVPNGRQAEFHSSRAGIVVASGGNQCGKTHCLLAQILANACGVRLWLPEDHPDFVVRRLDGRPMKVPNRGRLACVDYPNALTHAIFPKFMELAPRDLVEVKRNAQGYPTLWKFPWGSEIFVMSYDQDWLKYESGTFDWAGFDEPPPRRLFISTVRGLMREAGTIHMALTPHSEEWMLAEIYEKADEEQRSIEIIRMETKDNPVLSSEGIARFESMLTPVEKAIRLHGEHALALGRVTPDFDNKAPWVCEPFQVPADWYRMMVIDPHEEKPDALLWWAMSPDGRESVVYREKMDLQTRGSLKKTADAARQEERGERIVRRLIDPRAASKKLRQVERTVAQELALHGLKCEPAPGLTTDKGFKMVNGWFVKPEEVEEDWRPWCRVFSTCVETVRQLRYTNWVRDAQDYSMKRRVKGPDDFLACLRYLATWSPTVDKVRAAGYDERYADADDDAEASALLEEQGASFASGVHTGY